MHELTTRPTQQCSFKRATGNCVRADLDYNWLRICVIEHPNMKEEKATAGRNYERI